MLLSPGDFCRIYVTESIQMSVRRLCNKEMDQATTHGCLAVKALHFMMFFKKSVSGQNSKEGI
jgi:hypothetical protein